MRLEQHLSVGKWAPGETLCTSHTLHRDQRNMNTHRYTHVYNELCKHKGSVPVTDDLLTHC